MLSLNCSMLHPLITNLGVRHLCIMLQGNVAGYWRQDRAMDTYCHEGCGPANDQQAVVQLPFK
jgi:hypothetical protein